MRGIGKDSSALVEQADKIFEDATAVVTLADRSVIARLRSMDVADEVGIESPVQLSARTAPFIASVVAAASSGCRPLGGASGLPTVGGSR